MKRLDLIRLLVRGGCIKVRDQGKHTMWRNPATGATVPVPRHREIKERTARGILRQLGLSH